MWHPHFLGAFWGLEGLADWGARPGLARWRIEVSVRTQVWVGIRVGVDRRASLIRLHYAIGVWGWSAKLLKILSKIVVTEEPLATNGTGSQIPGLSVLTNGRHRPRIELAMTKELKR